MKRLFILFLCLSLSVTLCGCDVKSMFEDFSVTEVFSEIKSQLLNLSGEEEVVEIVEEYYTYSPEFDSCYNALNKKQKQIYKKIYSAAEVMPHGFIKLCENYDDAFFDISLAYKAVLNDRVDIFWMPDTYLLGRNKTANDDNIYISFSYSGEGGEVGYTVPVKTRDEMRAMLKNEVSKIHISLSGITDEFEKERFINDYICANTEYNKEAEFADTAYGCIVLKQALCEGYARAFKLLCNEVGIECDLVLGSAGGVGHMWNTVNIESEHSFVDVTWNDQNNSTYAYFNITKKQLDFDHIIAPLFKERTAEQILKGKQFNFVQRDCSYTGNTYYKRKNRVLHSGNEQNYASFAAEIITTQAKNGVFSAEFLLATDSLVEKFQKDSETFLAEIQYRLKGLTLSGYLFERDVLTLLYEVSN